MSRLDIKSPSRAQTVVDNLYRDVERRIAASPPGLCPVDMSLAFLTLCHAQSCGKCVPCRIGLGQLSKLIETVLDGSAEAHPYYVRTAAPDDFLRSVTADDWGAGVITGAVNTCDMLAWARRQLAVDPSCFIAGIR